MKKSNLLIAESGSSKTDWVYLENGVIVNQFQTGGINPFYLGISEIDALLEQQVVPKVPSEISEIHFYGAGCANDHVSLPVTSTLREKWPLTDIITVASDMLGAARGLCGHEAGIACILGTGANNALYDGRDIVGSIGSLGFWLGDEGSGSYLGKMLIVNYLQQELPTDLYTLFQQEFPEVDRLYILDRAYKQTVPNRFFATFTHFIANNKSHPYIQKFVSGAFKLFINKYVLKHKESKNLPINFTGSIAYYFQDILTDTIVRAGLQIGKIEKSPLQGLLEYHQV